VPVTGDIRRTATHLNRVGKQQNRSARVSSSDNPWLGDLGNIVVVKSACIVRRKHRSHRGPRVNRHIQRGRNQRSNVVHNLLGGIAVGTVCSQRIVRQGDRSRAGGGSRYDCRRSTAGAGGAH